MGHELKPPSHPSCQLSLTRESGHVCSDVVSTWGQDHVEHRPSSSSRDDQRQPSTAAAAGVTWHRQTDTSTDRRRRHRYVTRCVPVFSAIWCLFAE